MMMVGILKNLGAMMTKKMEVENLCSINSVKAKRPSLVITISRLVKGLRFYFLILRVYV
jgi:hypothetical protein